MLLSGRLFRSPRLSQMVSDSAVHDHESGPDCRGLHAYGLGAADPDLCYSAAARRGVGIRGHHGIRSELHAVYPVGFFRDRTLSRIGIFERSAWLGTRL